MQTELSHSFNIKLDLETSNKLKAEQAKLLAQFKEQRIYDSSPHLAIATKFMGEGDTKSFVTTLENEFKNDKVWELEFADFKLSGTRDYIFLLLSETSKEKLFDLHRRAFEATKNIGLEVQTGRKFRNFAYSPHISIIKILPEESEKALALVKEDLSGMIMPVRTFQITRQNDIKGGFSEFPVVREIELN